MSLTLLIFLPLAGAIFAICFPRKQVGTIAAFATLLQVGFIIPVLLNFETSVSLQQAVDNWWIRELGISYSLGLDGLNVFMVALTVFAWVIATIAASRRKVDNPRTYFALLALAETGTLGAFLAQDLILFILFFDLLLIPFYFLIGIWGQRRPRAATAKFMIYTLAGSLLMFASAIAMAHISAVQHDIGQVSFAFEDLVQNPVSGGAQNWIFLGFAVALLIKMPLPPFHGWMPDTYRAAPLPVLIPLSAVVAKLGAYGLLRVVLPTLPLAAQHFQDLMLVLAVIGIVYGSVMAFSQDDARLVVGYSSIAQIGFVALGIFAFDDKGVQGAMLQMLNHGIVVVGLFLVIGFLAERAGSDSLSRMGGLAKSAPLLAALFLVISLATLAMPGSANFVGELYILFGAFDGAFAYGAVATAGVVLAAVYMIRFYQRTMHGRGPGEGRSREIESDELGLLAPAVLVVLALAVYPQFVVKRIAPAADSALTAIQLPGASGVSKQSVDGDAGEPAARKNDSGAPAAKRPSTKGERTR
ncbi:MAG: NADH-quinone oxidoreductase subunit M [Actinobacteria bacterium]|nr:NADH-quinone oxidoreductase subunit M [Actinomycetota bacterium]